MVKSCKISDSPFDRHEIQDKENFLHDEKKVLDDRLIELLTI